MIKNNVIEIIGGGLAGCESAYFLAKRGYHVRLVDIKPQKFTPAHSNKNLGELVCSNSLKSSDVYGNACGLLKQEMAVIGSLMMECAAVTSVPAGNALAVDRELFAQAITDKINSFPNIERVCAERDEIDFNVPTIVATGPLTTSALCDFLAKYTQGFYFFDAAAPIISADSIDFENAFISDRYGEVGSGDYVNCPLDKELYLEFYEQLITAKRATLHEFESDKVFEGCMPVEVMATRGVDTLRFGPLKPAGLTDPKTGRWPYACLQLRKENNEGTMYNMVGFQTNLLFGEQKRVFSMVPALKNAEFLRYGVMHKNTYLNAPLCLDKYYCMKDKPFTYFAGQITGVEGYVESAASGLASAINLDRKLSGKEPIDWSDETVMGALARHISTENSDFQPMNANYGILRPLVTQDRNKQNKKRAMSERALVAIGKIKEEIYRED